MYTAKQLLAEFLLTAAVIAGMFWLARWYWGV